jgi:peptidoglycan/LPS O-acetylase OafA/YrhL
MEQSWLRDLRTFTHKFDLRRLTREVVAGAAFVGVFSYSLYLTHELVIMQSWWFTSRALPPVLNTLLIVVPATVLFAWVFYRYCERPYMRKAATVAKPVPQTLEPAKRVDDLPIEQPTAVFAET